MIPELLSPAGGLDAALAAFQYGADAVYIGLPRFSARADADNLTPERLRILLAYAHSFTPAKKVYITFNTLVQDAELPHALDSLATLDDLSPDGVIVQDLGVTRLIRDHFPRLAFHASTQLAAHNLDGVLALKALGFTRVVLARELTLDEIRHIVRESGVEIEIFVHGALCYSYSGLCLFSSHTAGRSGNRGRCAYCCREAFTAPDAAEPESSARFPFSMKDLALAPILDAVTATGAHSLKIEGRMKSPLYVACVTDLYRRKLDGTLTPDAELALVQDLQTVFSRPWTRLYAEGRGAHAETIIDPVAVGHRGALIGSAEAVIRDREGTRWLRFTTGRALEKHDGLQVELPSGGKPFGCAVNLLRAAGSQRTLVTLPAGSTAEVALPKEDVPMIPRGAPVFCSASQAVRRRYEIRNLRESALLSGHPVNLHVSLAPDGITVRAETTFEKTGDLHSDAVFPMKLTPSRQPEQTAPAVRKAFERLGDTQWQLGTLTLNDPHTLYAPPSKLNEIRRSLVEKLSASWVTRRTDRLAAIAATWGFASSPSSPGPSGLPAHWSLKLRAGTPLPHEDTLEGFQTLILAIGHTLHGTLEKQLDALRSVNGSRQTLLALPLITREPELVRLKGTLRSLAQRGWTDWECADLAGYHMLKEAGLKPASADWSLYVFNRVAAAELARLGFDTQVLSPEITPDNLRSLCSASRLCSAPAPELTVYQHTPLFISETAPGLSELSHLPDPQDTSVPSAARKMVSLIDRRGSTFVTQAVDRLWVTVCDSPYCLADRLDIARAAGVSRFRIDLSWSPEPESFPSVIQSVRAGRLPPGAQSSFFDHSLS